MEQHKVMLLDDDIINAMSVQDLPQDSPFELVTLSSPNGVMSKLEYERPEVFLFDTKIPRLSIAELLGRVKTSELYEDMMLILFSDADAAILEAECIKHEIDGYFCKSYIEDDPSSLVTFLMTLYDQE